MGEKLFGGRETALEVHRRTAWQNQHCTGCGRRDIVIRMRTLMLYKDVLERSPDIIGAMSAATDDGSVPVIQTTYGPMVCVGIAFACPLCQAEMEKQAAHPPRGVNAIIEIDRGPSPDQAVSQVPA